MRFILITLAGLVLFGLAGPLGAQPAAPAGAASNPPAAKAAAQPPENAAPAANQQGQSFWEILAASGWVGLVIGGLSVAALALVIEHIVTIRASVLLPPGLADDVRHLLTSGDPATALRRCREQPSLLAFVLAAGIGEAEGGWSAVEKATEDATADQAARLFRRIEYLSVIANLSTMLGLLGTVIGMVVAFRQVAITQGAARAADLAHGIYLALVTTVEGLLVAIPALAAFAILRNRVDQFVAETAYQAEHGLSPLKRRRGGAAPKSPPPPLPGGPG